MIALLRSRDKPCPCNDFAHLFPNLPETNSFSQLRGGIHLPANEMSKTILQIFAIGLACLIFHGSAYPRSAVSPRGTLIENVSIIDPAAERIEAVKGHVLIEGGIITYVGSSRPEVSGNIRVIDGRGKFLIPGLIDSHVHLANIAGLNWNLLKKYPELAAAYYRQLPRSYLYFGFTTVVDLNNHSPSILAPILEESVRPEIFTCGEQLEVFRGFMTAETDPADLLTKHPNFLYDQYNKNVTISGANDLSDHTPAASVRRIIRDQGGICVKMAYENGFGGTEEVTWEMPSKETVRAVSEETRRSNVPLMLHANSFESQQFAADTGVGVIAHGMWHWGPLERYLEVKDLPPTHRVLLEEIAARGIGYQPTFRVISGQRDVFDDEFIDDPNLKNVYPKDFLDWLKTVEGHWQQKQIKRYAKGFFDKKSNREIMSFMQLLVDKISVSSKLLADRNANLLLGSDTPSSNAHTNPPGYNGFLEMREWHAAGISLAAILRAATVSNAREFRIDKLYGSISAGKLANLLLLDKDPLSDITAYDSIEFVILKGNVLSRPELSAKSRNIGQKQRGDAPW